MTYRLYTELVGAGLVEEQPEQPPYLFDKRCSRYRLTDKASKTESRDYERAIYREES